MLAIQSFFTSQKIKAPMIERKVNGIIKGTAPMLNIHIKEQSSIVNALKKLIPYLLLKKDIAIEALKYTKDRLAKRWYGVTITKQAKRKYWLQYEIKQLICSQKKSF